MGWTVMPGACKSWDPSRLPRDLRGAMTSLNRQKPVRHPCVRCGLFGTLRLPPFRPVMPRFYSPMKGPSVSLASPYSHTTCQHGGGWEKKLG